MRRLAADRGGLAEDFAPRYVVQALRDWKVYVFGLMGTAAFTAMYSFSLFLPTIVQAMGYSAQLMSVPPYVAACVATIAASYAADRARHRGVFVLVCQVLAVSGYALLVGGGGGAGGGGHGRRPALQYAGTIFAAVSIYPQVPLGLAWNAANVDGSTKRAVAIAIQVMASNCGGLIASYVYLARDGPRYIQGHGILIGFIGYVTSLAPSPIHPIPTLASPFFLSNLSGSCNPPLLA